MYWLALTQRALLCLLHDINRFSGAKYLLGNPGRLGDVDEGEKRRLQEARRRARQEADVLEKEGDEEEEERIGSLWGNDDDDDDTNDDKV